jgi:GxxExxY protein
MGAIFEVHKRLGPGFLESVYQKALIEKLSGRGMNVRHNEKDKVCHRNSGLF